MTTVGILGTGSLAEMMVRGLEGSGYQFLLSPRGAATAARLKERYGCEITASNQDLVDRCENIFVSLPAATGHDELARLRFRAGQSVLSAMAGTRMARLAGAIGPATGALSMMPGYANALRIGPSILFPGSDFWKEFLGKVGPVFVLETEGQYVTAAAFGAFSGASIAWMTSAIRWFEAQGLSSDVARGLVAATLRGNSEVLLREHRDLKSINADVATPGGITELLLKTLSDAKALTAWDEALDAVKKRLVGPPGLEPGTRRL